MWFVYLTWYLINVVGLHEQTAGFAVLSGQIADGICTPITGVASDKLTSRWGKRYPWYVVGTFIVLPCFLGIFAYPPFINVNCNVALQTAWYVTLPALFNIGWAMV